MKEIRLEEVKPEYQSSKIYKTEKYAIEAGVSGEYEFDKCKAEKHKTEEYKSDEYNFKEHNLEKAKSEEIRKAKIKAMHILARMDKTEADLQAGLRRTGFSDEAVALAMEYVKAYGYVDDRNYAQKYVMYHKERKSRQKIKYELLNKGISRDLIDFAFEQCEDYDEREALRKAVHKKWKKEERPNEKELHKLFASLARQGYSNYDIWQVLQEENLT